jgi:hypothetical protein
MAEINEKVNGSIRGLAIEGFTLDFNWNRNITETPESMAINGSKVVEGKPTAAVNMRYNLKTGLWQLQGCENMLQTSIATVLSACASQCREIETNITAVINTPIV